MPMFIVETYMNYGCHDNRDNVTELPPGDCFVFIAKYQPHNLSSTLTNDLQKRLNSWNQQQCLGDVFIKFNLQLKAYTNFISNYPISLINIERSMEMAPKFRAFLKRHDFKPATKMLK